MSDLDNKIVFISILIPILFIFINMLDSFSSYARVAGFYLNKNSLGYSSQIALFAYSRVFTMFALPLMGFIVDNGINHIEFYSICILSFIFSGISQCIIYKNSQIPILFFEKRIKKMVNCKNITDVNSYKNTPPKYELKITIIALLIYTLNGISILMPFLLSTIFYENKVMMSQTSAFFNAIATFLMTTKLDPAMSIKIENSDGYIEMHKSTMQLKIIATTITCPILMSIIYYFARSIV